MSGNLMQFDCRTGDGQVAQTAAISHLVIAGWTGRDPEAVEAHIAELEALGVSRPRTTPIFYSVGANLLTQADSVQTAGRASSGEVEPVVLNISGELWLGVGSDHTDRALEAASVTFSKQVCPKPISRTLWRLSEIEARLDTLELRSYAVVAGLRREYQVGQLSMIRPLRDLISLGFGPGGLPEGVAMFCGTLAVNGAIEFATRFEMEILDPISGDRISHGYDIVELPLDG